jgi:nucleoside 2-deoxyribosyltransferase
MAKIYLAAPWFTDGEKVLYHEVLNKLRAEGHEVYAPIEHEQENAWDMPNHEWGLKVFQDDVKAIQNCEEVWVLNYGMYSDTGTAWECGYAYGIGKTVRQLLLTFGSQKQEYSLMMVNGCDEWDSMGNYLFNQEHEYKFEQK